MDRRLTEKLASIITQKIKEQMHKVSARNTVEVPVDGLEIVDETVPLLIDGKVIDCYCILDVIFECTPPYKGTNEPDDRDRNAALVDITITDIRDISTYDNEELVFTQEQLNKILEDNADDLESNAEVWHQCENYMDYIDDSVFEEDPDALYEELRERNL